MAKKLTLRLDLRSELPAYVQIARQVQERLAGGSLRVGEQLPTVRELARELGVNFNTVARAYRLLDREGALSAQQGRGTYAAAVPSRRAREKTRAKALHLLARRFIAEARSLGFSAREIERAVKDRLDA